MTWKHQIIFLLLLCSCKAQLPFRKIINTLLNISDDPTEKLIRDTTKFLREYDFIVIGSGSGGSVVANRLSEIPNWRVLLLEAGRDEVFLTEVPLLAAALDVTHFNWGFQPEKQTKACLSLRNGVCNWPSGKALGGTTVINDLLYSRGNKFDYDEWQTLGNDGWSYDDVLPYFIKSERAVDMNDIDKDYHGTEGYLNIEHTPYKSPIVDRFLETANEFGYSIVDVNGKNPIGFAPVQSTMRSGRRCSSSKAFLRPIRNRSNLHVAKEAVVTKILIDPESKQTFGVEFRKNGKLYQINATKEVILSAGAVNSPQLLMLSGVGPKAHLDDMNINVIQDLPVGYNLQDHVSFPGLVFLVNESVTLTGPKILNIPAMYNNLANRKGPYTVPGGAEAYAFVNTKTHNITDKYFSDLEIILAGAALNSDALGIVRNLLRIPDTFYNNVYNGIKDKDGFAVVPIIMKPYSRGRIMLRSKDPFKPPVVHPNFFQDERDLEVMLNGIKMAVAVGESQSFQRYQSKLNPRPYPGCEHLNFRSEAYWRCCVQNYTSSLYHYAGTCKMGPSHDPSAVVDPRLKVKGVKGLRVVDGSIIPKLMAGHTNAPIIMIGEKASDMIKEDWRYDINMR